MLGAPLVYHDPAKQLCLVHFPQEMSVSPQEQERFVGEVTTLVMRELPTETPRGYLLNPKRFLTIQSLLEAVYEADGVSKETLEAQRQRVELISQLAEALGDEAGFKAIVQQHKAAFDAEFITTLNAFIEASHPQDPSRQLLVDIREQLGATLGQSLDEAGEFGAAEADEIAEAFERLSQAEEAQLPQLVAEYRYLLDSSFFEMFTTQVEALEATGDEAQAAALTTRRDAIIELVEALDNETRELFERGTALLEAVMNTEDPSAALRERMAEIDDGLLLAISANGMAAQRAGQNDLVAELAELGQLAVVLIEERMTPQERLLNELLAAETPQEATRLLRKNVPLINPELVQLFNQRAEQEEQRGNSEPATALRRLAREAGAMLF